MSSNGMDEQQPVAEDEPEAEEQSVVPLLLYVEVKARKGNVAVSRLAQTRALAVSATASVGHPPIFPARYSITRENDTFERTKKRHSTVWALHF